MVNAGLNGMGSLGMEGCRAVILELKPIATETDLEIAGELRELADKLEAGEVAELVVVANLRADGQFMRVAKFDDAWKALGAIEYAKMTVHRGMDCD